MKARSTQSERRGAKGDRGEGEKTDNACKK